MCPITAQTFLDCWEAHEVEGSPYDKGRWIYNQNPDGLPPPQEWPASALASDTAMASYLAWAGNWSTSPCPE